MQMAGLTMGMHYMTVGYSNGSEELKVGQKEVGAVSLELSVGGYLKAFYLPALRC